MKKLLLAIAFGIVALVQASSAPLPGMSYSLLMGTSFGGNQSSSDIYTFAQKINAQTTGAVAPTAGGTLTINGVALGNYSFSVFKSNQTVSSFSSSTFFTSTADTESAFVVVNGDLTINAGQTFIPSSRKLFTVIYVTGNLAVNGTISMSARGANSNATTAGTILIASGTHGGISNPQVGATCGTGGAATAPSGSGNAGNTGASASAGCTGGGGSGATINGPGSSGAGATGTAFGGGSAGGGNNSSTSSCSSAAANGGAGGAACIGAAAGGAGGGAGNPGGAGQNGVTSGSPGADGTGGTLIIIVGGTYSGSGTVTCAGSAGGDATNFAAGGGSGGGSCNVMAGTNSGPSPSATGGAGGSSISQSGGAGGAGTGRAFTIALLRWRQPSLAANDNQLLAQTG